MEHIGWSEDILEFSPIVGSEHQIQDIRLVREVFLPIKPSYLITPPFKTYCARVTKHV